MGSVVLSGQGVTKFFGGLRALNEVTFDVKQGEILALIGPNGAGKTTLFNVITGFYKPDRGAVKFEGKNITGLRPHTICRLGVVRTFQLTKTFSGLSALENVFVGNLYGRDHSSSVKRARERAFEILKITGLAEKADLPAEKLTLADRRRLGLARALAANPKILLLDEIVAGLNPTEASESNALIKRIRDELKITVFVIEHVMKTVMEISDRIIVLHHGEKIAEGEPKDVVNDIRVAEAYLGTTTRV